MFEKEAGEYRKNFNYYQDWHGQVIDKSPSTIVEQAYKDGAEFGLKQHAHDYLVKTKKLKEKYEKQIEKMKCCENCKGVCDSDDVVHFCKNNDYKLWEIKEK